MKKKTNNKYSFLSNFEIKLLKLISKSKIDFNSLRNIKKENIDLYFKNQANFLKLNNEKGYEESILTDDDVDILFYLKKNKVNLKKVYKYLTDIKNLKLVYYPDPLEFNYIRKNNYKKVYASLLLLVLLTSTVFFNINNASSAKSVDMLKASATVIANNKPKIDIESAKQNFYKDKFLNKDINELINQNSDTVGWIKVQNTKIDYPFLQTDDNEYYLNNSFYKKESIAGAVFMDYRDDFNTTKNIILYAHGRMHDETLFGQLKYTLNEQWYSNEDNLYIRTSTKDENQLWKVFSTYTIEPESYYIRTIFESDDEYQTFLTTLKERSFHDFNEELNVGDRILTLSTCYNSSRRMVLHAKLVSTIKK